ncbi:MAG: thioredoxin family protein [Gammaproteobacteria bacterium]|nr:thioredoxin family protein [Gammaproteobacteria bacterium]
MTKDTKNNISAMDLLINNDAASVLMLMGPGCSYCGPMMQALTELMKAGKIAELRILDIQEHSELATELGVRSVPWLQIGPFELSGSRTKKEISLWLQRASGHQGLTEYIDEVLAEGNIAYAKKLIQHYPAALESVIDLMADADAKINVRLGVGVIIEELAATDQFKAVLPKLINYLSGDDARVRGDACHYLSLTNDVSVIPFIEKLLSDESAEVREIAQDSLDELRGLQ